MRRTALALSLVLALGMVAAGAAQAFTLKLVFADGQPMTYGSACLGAGCMDADRDVATTNASGEIELSDGLRTIEYRRDGISLSQAPVGIASGTLMATGDRATVTLSRVLSGTAPALDAAESDLVAKINEVRAGEGRPLAQINPRLAAAADLQATWLMQSGVLATEPDRFHSGPFDSTMPFRLGEVSFPDPARGREIAAAGGTTAEALWDWMGSPAHREQLLEAGPMLIGVGRVGGFIVVEMHAPCAGCAQMGTGVPAGGAPLPAPPPAAAPPAPLAPPPPTTARTTAGSSAQPSCGSERLRGWRLRDREGRARVRVQTRCLRPGSRYVLILRRAGRTLRMRRLARAGTITFRLPPPRRSAMLHIKLKRDGRAVAARSLRMP